jgi:hypothetical protein
MSDQKFAASVYNILVAGRAIASANGDPAGAWVMCSSLIGSNDIFSGKQLIIVNGAGKGDLVGITNFNPVNGRLDLSPSLQVQCLTGDDIIILNIINSTAFTSILGLILNNTDLIPLTQGLVYYGVVTDIPGANQFTISSLSGLGAGKFASVIPQYAYQAFVMRDAAGGSAAPQGESKAITGYATLTGNFSAGVFTSAVDIGDEVLIIHPLLLPLLKLSGVPGATGNLVGNWNTAETDVCIIGAPNTRYKVHNVTIGIGALVGNITIRIYANVNGVERCIFPIPGNTIFNVATDQAAIQIVNSSFGIKNALRVTVQSDNPADNGASVEYDYLIEAM